MNGYGDLVPPANAAHDALMPTTALTLDEALAVIHDVVDCYEPILGPGGLRQNDDMLRGLALACSLIEGALVARTAPAPRLAA